MILASAARAEIIYNLPWSNTITTFGGGGAKAYGQILTAPAADHVLADFGVRVEPLGVQTFNLKVSAFDLSTGTLVGAPLYTSLPTSTPASGPMTEYLFHPNLTLTPGSTYMAYIDSTDFPGGAGARVAGDFGNGYPDGAFSFTTSGTNSPWFVSTNGQDLAFRATFVPEPAASCLLAGALMACARRRDRRYHAIPRSPRAGRIPATAPPY